MALRDRESAHQLERPGKKVQLAFPLFQKPYGIFSVSHLDICRLVLAVFLNNKTGIMNALTADDYKQDVVVPPANFQIWPLTRIGAITIDIVILIVVLLLWFIPRKVYRTEHLDDGNSIQRYVSGVFVI